MKSTPDAPRPKSESLDWPDNQLGLPTPESAMKSFQEAWMNCNSDLGHIPADNS